MGGWVAIQVAKANKEVVKGIVGVAADPDFTTDIVLPMLSAETIDKINNQGYAVISWGNSEYELSKVFVDDAEKNLLLRGGPSSIDIRSLQRCARCTGVPSCLPVVLAPPCHFTPHMTPDAHARKIVSITCVVTWRAPAAARCVSSRAWATRRSLRSAR